MVIMGRRFRLKGLPTHFFDLRLCNSFDFFWLIFFVLILLKFSALRNNAVFLLKIVVKTFGREGLCDYFCTRSEGIPTGSDGAEIRAMVRISAVKEEIKKVTLKFGD